MWYFMASRIDTESAQKICMIFHGGRQNLFVVPLVIMPDLLVNVVVACTSKPSVSSPSSHTRTLPLL